MLPLKPNPETGFLETVSRNAFDSAKKLELLRMAQEFVDKEEYPDLNYITKKLGLSMNCFWRHHDQDPNFREAYKEIETQIENILNRSLVVNAKRANGVGAAAFWLKNRMANRWSDNPGMNQSFVDLSSLKKALEAGNQVFEAEIVDGKQ